MIFINRRLSKFLFSRLVEQKWQRIWANRAEEYDGIKQKFYCLSQFPYPSGNLHMGHARVYFISDIISRYHRLRGKYVVHPIGWDSFGLPAQNAAIQNKIEPSAWTQKNIQEMKNQMIRLGLMFDWHREIATHQPEYYKWTQQIFLNLFKHGLAYKKQAQVNWDPVDQTVLANEQVDINGNSWRSGARVEKKMLNQWFFKITEFGEQLENDLQKLNWPDKVKQMQKGWIGRRIGNKIRFKIVSHVDHQMVNQYLQIFTTRIQTIMGCTFLAVHSTTQNGTIIGQCQHPITKQILNVYAADYVLKQYGTGSVMGVPAHHQKDKAFSEKFGIPALQVVNQENRLINSDKFNGLHTNQAKQAIQTELNNLGLCEYHTILSIKDWLVSRQRYWGCPIPIIYCKKCGIQPVPDKDLPVLLPSSTLSEGNPLVKSQFKTCQCPKCQGEGSRESDTLDTFVDSSWYYLRYLDNLSRKEIVNKQIANKLMPVDVYIGGIEHAIMHLLYARFINKALCVQNIYSIPEPFKELIVQGLVKGKAYKLKSDGKYLKPSQTAIYRPDQIIETFEKMSKSKFNGINPINMVDKYSSDALRLALMFSAPLEKDLDFREEQVERMLHLIKRVKELQDKIEGSNGTAELQIRHIQNVVEIVQSIQKSIEKVYALHVYCARIMELHNLLQDCLKLKINRIMLSLIYKILIVCINPLIPHQSSQILEHLRIETAIEQQIFGQTLCWPSSTKLKNILLQPDIHHVRINVNNKFYTTLKLNSKELADDASIVKRILENDARYSKKPVLKVIRQSTEKGVIMNILTGK